MRKRNRRKLQGRDKYKEGMKKRRKEIDGEADRHKQISDREGIEEVDE